MIREKVYSKETYAQRKRYFRDQFEILDDAGNPYAEGG